MADVFHGADMLQRSVWVVVDPRDLVTGMRVTRPLDVRLKAVTAMPIVGRSGVYCFTDLNLPAASYTVSVRGRGARDQYFDAERDFLLDTVPVPGQPLQRNLITLDLLPRPAYPFAAGTTLARGRLVTAGNATAISSAAIDLVLEGVDEGLRGRSDERGEFAVPFPRTAPDESADAVLKTLHFRLRFTAAGHPSFLTAEQTVLESRSISFANVEYPGT
jgi:hypothetical protein